MHIEKETADLVWNTLATFARKIRAKNASQYDFNLVLEGIKFLNFIHTDMIKGVGIAISVDNTVEKYVIEKMISSVYALPLIAEMNLQAKLKYLDLWAIGFLETDSLH